MEIGRNLTNGNGPTGNWVVHRLLCTKTPSAVAANQERNARVFGVVKRLLLIKPIWLIGTWRKRVIREFSR